MDSKNLSIFLIGNFLSKTGINPGISEELRIKLLENNWRVVFASSYINKGRRILDMIFSAIRCRKSYQAASIEIYSGKAFVFSEVMSLVLNILNKPSVGTLHGGHLAAFEAQNPRRVRRVLDRLTKVATPSFFLQDHFSKIREDIIHIPNGIDLENYEYQNRQNPAPKLIWLRALHEIYAPTLAVEVIHLLSDKVSGISLTMVGPDKGDGSLEKIEEMASEYGLRDAVSIIGGVDKTKVPYWLNQGDVFINTTRYESFGVSVLEAAACGLPIVTTDAGELPYMWENGVDALVVPVDNAHAMADAVDLILTEPELAGKLSANARKKAEGYDWSLIMPQWEKLFEELINQNS